MKKHVFTILCSLSISLSLFAMDDSDNESSDESSSSFFEKFIRTSKKYKAAIKNESVSIESVWIDPFCDAFAGSDNAVKYLSFDKLADFEQVGYPIEYEETKRLATHVSKSCLLQTLSFKDIDGRYLVSALAIGIKNNKNTMISEILFSCRGLCNKDLVALGSMLENNNKIKSIAFDLEVICKPDISAEGVIALAKALETNRSLSSLKFMWCEYYLKDIGVSDAFIKVIENGNLVVSEIIMPFPLDYRLTKLLKRNGQLPLIIAEQSHKFMLMTDDNIGENSLIKGFPIELKKVIFMMIACSYFEATRK